MPVLKVHFEFLCAFVPDRPFDPEAPAPRNATVLMRDLSAVDGTDGVWGPEGPKPHFAHLQFHEENGPSEQFNKKSPQAPWLRLLLLEEEEVTFRPDGQDPASDSLTVNLNPTAEDRDSLLWLVRMEEVAPGKEHVKNTLLSGSGPHDPPIASRVKLSQGHLSAGRLTPGAIRLRGGAERKIALSALLELPFEEHVEVRLAKFDDEGTFRTLRLAPNEDDFDDPESVTIFVRNSEDVYLFGDTRGLGPYGGPDRDFQHYYDLAESFSPGAARPVPVGLDLDGSHGTCSPVGFKQGTGG